MSERKKTARTGDCPAACDKNESAKAQKKTSAKKKVRTALMSTVIALSASAIAGLSVALYYSEQRAGEQQSYISSMEAVYSRSYYDLLDSANDLEVQLMKLRAAGTPEAQSRILYDVWQTATSASQSLAAFEGEREGVMKANKFLGQLGDYARVLAEKLADGEGLTASETDTLEDMRGVAAAFKDALADTRSGKEEGRLFLGDGGMLGGFSASFDSFAEPDFDYPSMIYDGPFSDALEDRECKALRGLPAVSAEEGAAKLAGMIRGAENIKFRERTESDIVTLSYTFDREGGSGFAQLTEQGGLLALCDISLGETAADGGMPEHLRAAVGFAKQAGYGDTRVVWCSVSHGTVYVNLAPVSDGVVLYPDLIKVKVDAASGEVTGLDAAHYIFNHTARDLPAPVLTPEQAAGKVTLPAVGSPMLCLIPQDETREVLAYEIECASDGTYFVYIDAVTGEETDILYVVDGEQGRVTV